MGQVTPLFKKDDEFNKANYRLVTVLPVLNDIYERLLATQLSEFYSTILSDFISSYRKFYSCETALLRLTEDWRRMRDRGELVAVVSMDLSKAFDVMQHDLLIGKLKHMESVKEVVRYLKTTCQEDSSEQRSETPSPIGRTPEEEFLKGAFWDLCFLIFLLTTHFAI